MGHLCQRKEPKTGKGIESKSLCHETEAAKQYRGPRLVGMPCSLNIIHARKYY